MRLPQFLRSPEGGERSQGLWKGPVCGFKQGNEHLYLACMCLYLQSPFRKLWLTKLTDLKVTPVHSASHTSSSQCGMTSPLSTSPASMTLDCISPYCWATKWTYCVLSHNCWHTLCLSVCLLSPTEALRVHLKTLGCRYLTELAGQTYSNCMYPYKNSLVW